MAFAFLFGGTEETEQALPVKGIRHSAQRMLRQTRFIGAFLGRLAEKDHGSYPFVQALFWSTAPLLDQVVIVSALPSFPLRFGHGLASCATRRFWEIVAQDASACQATPASAG